MEERFFTSFASLLHLHFPLKIFVVFICMPYDSYPRQFRCVLLWYLLDMQCHLGVLGPFAVHFNKMSKGKRKKCVQASK